MHSEDAGDVAIDSCDQNGLAVALWDIHLCEVVITTGNNLLSWFNKEKKKKKKKGEFLTALEQ